MKLKILLGCAVLVISGCGQDDGEYGSGNGYEQVEANQASATVGQRPGGGQQLALHPFHDPQSGMTSVEMPFPADWRVARNRAQGQPTITGPRGLKIFDFPAQNFLYTNDPQMQQIYYQSGQQLRAMPGVDGLLEQDIRPWAEQQGLRFLKKFEIPEVARVDQWYHQQLFQAVPTQVEHAVFGTEWEATSGDKFFLLTHLTVGSGNDLQTWFHYSTGLQAENGYYEAAKKHLIYGLANARYNPQQIQAYNQREAQKAGQSWAAHSQRMRNNQASFEATQRAIVGANNAVNDSIMQGWRDRNTIQDRGHDAYIDSVRDQSTMYDPSTGQAWEVESGANNYWMNSDGEYFTTDDYNYNPNIDPALNDQYWQQLQDEEW